MHLTEAASSSLCVRNLEDAATLARQSIGEHASREPAYRAFAAACELLLLDLGPVCETGLRNSQSRTVCEPEKKANTAVPRPFVDYKQAIESKSRMDVAILRSANVVVAGLLAIALELTACQSFGPDRVPADQFNYNESIAESNRSQMPLKLVRICYRDAPVFLTVSSVLTQYIYSGSAGVSGTVGTSLGEPANAVTGSTGLIYIERPTITYTRLSGGNFVNQLLRPISTDLVFSLVESGWPPEWLMMMMNLERLNHLTNLPFDTEPTPEVREQFGNFQRAVRLIIELARRNAIESRHSDDAKAAGDRVLVLDDSKDRQTRALVDEFKRLLILIVRVSSFVSRSGLHGASPIKSPSAFVRLSR